MSNRVVPGVYRSVIDDVAEQVRTDFDDVGVEDAVLAELIRAWEYRVAGSRVADFTQDPKMRQVASQFPMLPLQPQPQPVPVASASVSASSTSQSSSKPVVTSTAPGSAAPPKKAPATEADEDAINSDLDDPDDDLDDDDDEEGAGRDGEEGAGGNDDIVIALYEKVQRVKNKWKVTLKDGLVAVNGREYLFNKCSGEFEW